MGLTFLLLSCDLLQGRVQALQGGPSGLHGARDVARPREAVADVELLPRHDGLVPLGLGHGALRLRN